MYKVKQEDLVGRIKDFPIEVVQKMVEEQVKQSDDADVTAFQESPYSGFLWLKTKDGVDFWNAIIEKKNFNLFFETYPKYEQSDNEETKEEVDTHVYYRGVWNRGNEIISELEKLGGVNDYGRYNGKDSKEYYFIHPIDHLIRHISIESRYPGEALPLDFLKSFYTEKFLLESKSGTIEIDGKKYNKQEVLDRIKELKEVKQ